MTGRPRRPAAPSGREEHLAWLSLTEVSGPFLTVPVLTRIWPTLEAVDKPTRDALAVAHAGAAADPDGWIDWVLTGLLGWGDTLDTTPDVSLAVAEHDATVAASFAVRDPTSNTRVLLGMTTPAGQHPAGRVRDQTWAASPIDRMAMLCRAEGVELGLVTDGRWWALVWAPRGKVTSSAVFDSVTWPESADRVVVRAFTSLLQRRRFFGVPDDQRLPALLAESVDNQEEITEQLGVQVRQAVELLVQAIGRDEQRAIAAGGTGLDQVSAEEVYSGAVTVMMRIVFLLYAEERGLLPADNDLYAAAYSAARLGEQLQARADEAGEETLQNSHTGWYRLLALFAAVHAGIDHPLLTLHAYDGSIFDPAPHAWLTDVRVDDQAVLHMLAAVQRVSIKGETRRLSFRSLDVEQIGYVYEGLLSFNGYRAGDVVLGLTGRLGAEEEVHLSDLEALHDSARDDAEFAETLATKYKSSGIGSPRAITKRLGDIAGAARSAAEGILAAVTANDPDLIDRLLPFRGLIRTDLRGLPMVIRPGALYVTQSPLRASTGTHYTPKFLAEQIVDGALEPLLYSPGPLQTADKTQWQPRTSTQILALRVADIAMGSGAFLVAACRHLGKALVEAWAREGDPRAVAATTSTAETGAIDTEIDPVVTEARRQVIEHCLYGVDINPMAVEMAKLSLWLVSMDPDRPFTFLDDRLQVGDSLLGITSLDQLEAMHLVPARGREIHRDGLIDFTAGIRERVQQAAKDREQLSDMTGESLAELTEKRAYLDSLTESTRDLTTHADLLVAASLANAGSRGPASFDAASNLAVSDIQRLAAGSSAAVVRVRRDRLDWLDADMPPGGFPREPFHWPIAFPEVFVDGGFDAIVGNPPFLGGKKISVYNGSAYREFLVQAIGNGLKGNADLVAYFVLRATSLLNNKGNAGLIATNTLAQGDTRLVGLDQIAETGVAIFRAVKSESWPSKSAALQYCAIWISRATLAAEAPRQLDGRPVRGITTTLDPMSRASGVPHRLMENEGTAFIGSFVLGLGFTMPPETAREFIAQDRRNAEVLFPYLNGQDLNNRPDSSASRWIVNFSERTEAEARSYPGPWEWVLRNVRPERLEKDATKYPRMVNEWWKYWNARPGMLRATANLEQVIVITRVSKVVLPVIVRTGQVFNERIVVFARDDFGMLAVLSSAPHYWWVIKNTTAHGVAADPTYAPDACFLTLARPNLTPEISMLGGSLDSLRRSLMLARQAGLTATYNLVHDPSCFDSEIAELRAVHGQIDEAVCRAYGWSDLVGTGLDHGFHETKQGVRYTVGPEVRHEILDRLLELNHERCAAEQASGVGVTKRSDGQSAQAELFA